eukprot:403362240
MDNYYNFDTAKIDNFNDNRNYEYEGDLGFLLREVKQMEQQNKQISQYNNQKQICFYQGDQNLKVQSFNENNTANALDQNTKSDEQFIFRMHEYNPRENKNIHKDILYLNTLSDSVTSPNNFQVSVLPASSSQLIVKQEKQQQQKIKQQQNDISYKGENGQDDIIKNRVFECTLCRKTFTRKNRVKIHMKQTHQGQPNRYECTICNKQFGERGNLKVHIRIHFKQQPYQCRIEGCQKIFNTHGNRKDHELRHFQNKFSRQYILFQNDELKFYIGPLTVSIKNSFKYTNNSQLVEQDLSSAFNDLGQKSEEILIKFDQTLDQESISSYYKQNNQMINIENLSERAQQNLGKFDKILPKNSQSKNINNQYDQTQDISKIKNIPRHPLLQQNLSGIYSSYPTHKE